MLEYTTETGFLPRIKCSDVESGVRCLVESLQPSGRIRDAEQTIKDVMRREQEGSTAIGGGLAIPHARSKAVGEVSVAVATLEQPIVVTSDEDRQVDVLILLAGPDGDPRLMLRVLARLARLVKQPDFLDGLRAAETPEQMQAVFAQLD